MAQRAFYSSGDRTPPSSYECAYVCLVLRGGYVEETPFGVKSRAEGTAHFHSPGEITSGVIGREDTEVISVAAGHERYKSLGELPPNVELPSTGSGPIPWLIREVAARMETSDSNTPLLLEARSIELFCECALWLRHERPKAPAWLDCAKKMLEGDRSVREIALECGVHPASFARSFKQWEHCTPNDFRRRCRLQRARALLANRRLTIGEVAAIAGYSDQSHLSREFRRCLNMRPSQLLDR